MTPRKARLFTPEYPHHIISRFTNRQWLLIGPKERDYYLACAKQACAKAKVRASAYGLMSSHIHWALCSNGDPLSKLLHPMHTRFGLWWNRKNGGLGKVFAERPTSIIVNKEEQLALLVAYIHNNPVRAGIVTDPRDSDWTSHRYYIGESPAPAWLDVEWTLAAMGYSSSVSGRLSFDDFVRSRSSLPRDPRFARGVSSDPRRTTINLLSTISLITNVNRNNIVQCYKAQSRAEITRGIRARSIFLYVGQRVFGLTASQLAIDTGLSRQKVSEVIKEFRLRESFSQEQVSEVVERYLEVTSTSNS